MLALLGLSATTALSLTPSLRTCWEQAPTCRWEGQGRYGRWKITFGGSNGGHQNYSQRTFIGTEEYEYFKGPGADKCDATATTHIFRERFSYGMSADGALVRTKLETLALTVVGAQSQEDVENMNNASSPQHCICGGKWVLGVQRTLNATSCNATTCPMYYNGSNFESKVYGVDVQHVTLNPQGKSAGAVEGCTLRRTYPRVANLELGWQDAEPAQEARAALSSKLFTHMQFTRCDGASCGSKAQGSWEQSIVVVLVVVIPIVIIAAAYWNCRFKLNRLEEGGNVELSDLSDDDQGKQEAQISISNQATVM